MKARYCQLICLLVLLQCFFGNVSLGGPISGDDFVKIEGGCFQMGDQFGDGLVDELPVHRVCLSDYYLSKYEVTQAQYQYVMGSNPSHDQTNPNYPVDVINYHEVERFIETLNSKTDGKFRLPTEAEWEYACRSAGKDEKYCGGNDGSKLAWYGNNSDEKTHSVAQKQANGLGLHDMSGNVWEWTLSEYKPYPYKKNDGRNDF